MEDETIKLMFTDIKDDQKRILLLLDGNGNRPGMKIEVDRLIQESNNRKWTFRASVGAIFALFTELLFRRV